MTTNDLRIFMRIAVITDKKIPKIISGQKLQIIPWDNQKLESENLRDYDGIIIDADSYNELDKILLAEDIEDEVILPMITYDVLNAPPSLFIVLGDPSRRLEDRDILGATGFTGTHIKGAGTQHKLTEAGSKSIYKDYLSDIKRYKYSYDTTFETAHEIQRLVHFGNHMHYMTQYVPLMKTKTGYLTAFQLQGKAYNERIQSSQSLFKKELPTFLPSHPDGLEKGLGIILKSIKEQDTGNDSGEPDWASQIIVQGQEKIDTEINTKSEQIQTLESENAGLKTERRELRKVLEILYLSDKPLEGALKRALQNCKYTVDEPEDNNNVEFYLRNGEQEFVVEVKSSLKPQFNKEGLRQVNEWRENESLDSGKEYKPILILSNQYDKPLEERNTEGVLDENLLTFAKSRNIVVVTVVVLYQALQFLSEGKITKNHLSNVLFTNSGMLNITDFYQK